MSLSRTAIRAALVIAVTAGLLAVWQSARGGESPALAPTAKHGTTTTLTRLYPHGIVVVGDSHMQQYLAALDQVAKRRNWEVIAMNKGACPFST